MPFVELPAPPFPVTRRYPPPFPPLPVVEPPADPAPVIRLIPAPVSPLIEAVAAPPAAALLMLIRFGAFAAAGPADPCVICSGIAVVVVSVVIWCSTAPAVVAAVVSPVFKQDVPLVSAQLIVRGLFPLAMVAMAPVALTTPLKGRPVALVSVPELGVPSTGVTNVGDVHELLPTQTVPFVVGKVMVTVDVAAPGVSTVSPLEFPDEDNVSVPFDVPATPSFGVTLQVVAVELVV